jgi:hypothetical protein
MSGRPSHEEQVDMSSRLYDARRAVRSLAGDAYPRLVQSWMRLVRMAMARENKLPLPAMLSLAKHVDEPFDYLWLMAAAVEVIEART